MQHVGSHLPVEGKTRRRWAGCAKIGLKKQTQTLCTECGIAYFIAFYNLSQRLNCVHFLRISNFVHSFFYIVIDSCFVVSKFDFSIFIFLLLRDCWAHMTQTKRQSGHMSPLPVLTSNKFLLNLARLFRQKKQSKCKTIYLMLCIQQKNSIAKGLNY